MDAHAGKKKWPLTASWKICIILELHSQIQSLLPDVDIMRIIAASKNWIILVLSYFTT